MHAGRKEDTDVNGDFGDHAKVPNKKRSFFIAIVGNIAATRFIINSIVWTLRPVALPPANKKSLRRDLGGPRSILNKFKQ
jgi:hypothetical protein